MSEQVGSAGMPHSSAKLAGARPACRAGTVTRSEHGCFTLRESQRRSALQVSPEHSALEPAGSHGQVVHSHADVGARGLCRQAAFLCEIQAPCMQTCDMKPSMAPVNHAHVGAHRLCSMVRPSADVLATDPITKGGDCVVVGTPLTACKQVRLVTGPACTCAGSPCWPPPDCKAATIAEVCWLTQHPALSRPLNLLPTPTQSEASRRAPQSTCPDEHS